MAFNVNPASKIERAVRALIILQGIDASDAAAFQANGDCFVANDSRVREVLPNRTIFCSSFTPERPYRMEGRCRFQIEHRIGAILQPDPQNQQNPNPIVNWESARVQLDSFLGDTIDLFAAITDGSQNMAPLADAITNAGRWLATPDAAGGDVAASIVTNNLDMGNFRCDWVKFSTPMITRGKDEGGINWIEILNFEAFVSNATLSNNVAPAVPYNPLIQTVNISYSGSGNPNGVQYGNPGDIYNEIDAGQFTQQWIKAFGVGTNTGWQ